VPRNFLNTAPFVRLVGLQGDVDVLWIGDWSGAVLRIPDLDMGDGCRLVALARDEQCEVVAVECMQVTSTGTMR